jgi:uncharacterized protein (DUF2267 family)
MSSEQRFLPVKSPFARDALVPGNGGWPPLNAVVYSDSWLHDFMNRLGQDDPHEAFALLLAGLRALRDSLPPQQAAVLGRHLPLLLRDLYLKGLRPVKLMVTEQDRDFFFKTLRREAVGHSFDATLVVHALLSLLEERIGLPDRQEIFDALPAEILALGKPEALQARTARA